MARAERTNAHMLEALKGYQISATVKELLTPHGQDLKTWGEVDDYMQQQHRRKSKFVVTQTVALQLLRLLRKAYRRRKSPHGWRSHDMGRQQAFW